MANEKQIERNVTHSFQLVKHDIERLWDAFQRLDENMRMINQKLETIDAQLHPKVLHSVVMAAEKRTPKKKTVVKRVVKRSKSKDGIVGSDLTEKYHKADCRMVKEIKYNNRIHYKTAKQAKKDKMKPCKICIKRK